MSVRTPLPSLEFFSCECCVPDSPYCQMYLIRRPLTVEVVSEPLVRIKYTEVRDVHYGKATSAVSFTSRPSTLSTEIITDETVRVSYRPAHALFDPP